MPGPIAPGSAAVSEADAGAVAERVAGMDDDRRAGVETGQHLGLLTRLVADRHGRRDARQRHRH